MPTTAILAADKKLTWRELMVSPRVELESLVRNASTDLPPEVDSTGLTPIDLWARTSLTGAASIRRDRDGVVVVHDNGAVRTRLPATVTLSTSDIAQLRGLRAIHLRPDVFDGPAELASFLSQAACAALPVVVGVTDPLTRQLLGAELATEFGRGGNLDVADDLALESWLVRLHRAAFTRFVHVTGKAPPSVSVIVATNRPANVPGVLQQIARQTFRNVEVILGLHGATADHPKVQQALQVFDRPCVVREIDRTYCLGEVLHDLTACASGQLIAKMDDDDWYGEHHLADLVNARHFSDATVVGSGAEFCYLAELDLTTRRQAHSGHRYSRNLAGGTLLTAAANLQNIGGWRPMPRAVDTALIDAIIEAGGTAYRTHGLGFVLYRGVGGHTWRQSPEYFLRRVTTQWPGFVPPPEIAHARPPAVTRPPGSWFDQFATQ